MQYQAVYSLINLIINFDFNASTSQQVNNQPKLFASTFGNAISFLNLTINPIKSHRMLLLPD